MDAENVVEELVNSEAGEAAEETVSEEVYQPRSTAPEKEPIIGERTLDPRPSSLMTKLGAWIFGLAVFCACLVYFKKKGFLGGMANGLGAKQLEVLETTALGSKQFLVLARARNKEILLGVGPGFISKLEVLDAADEKLPSAESLNDEFTDPSQLGGGQ